MWPFSGGRMTDPRFRVRQTIVFVQIAIATTLLAGAALLIASFHRLMAVPPGFNTDRTLLADVSLPVSRYSRDTRGPFYARLLDRVRSVHGVEAAGAGGPLPLSGLDGLLRFGPMTMEGRLPTPDRLQRAYVRWATPEYFRAMGIGVRAGRVFAESDTAASAPVAVVDADFARRYFGSDTPIGRRVKMPLEQTTWREIVGVVGTVRQTALDREPEPHLYVPQAQLPSPELTLVIRVAGNPTDLTASVREQMRSLDADLPLSNVRTLADLVAGSAEPRRLGALLMSLFAAIALLLTLVGVYGAVAQVVAQSTKEIGVRIAMGATHGDVVSLVVLRALRMALSGVAAGWLLAWVATPALRSMLYGIAPHDPLALLGAGAVLTAAASLAAYLPARRVLRFDVINALRVE